MSTDSPSSPSIAVLIPCYQEEKTIGKVVADFRPALPRAAIYVYDNNCTDATADFPEFRGASYRDRYAILVEKLLRERLYDGACLLLSRARFRLPMASTWNPTRN